MAFLLFQTAWRRPGSGSPPGFVYPDVLFIIPFVRLFFNRAALPAAAVTQKIPARERAGVQGKTARAVLRCVQMCEFSIHIITTRG